MAPRNFRFGSRHFVIEVEELEDALWRAWLPFKGTTLEARSNSAQSAEAALLFALRAELSVPGRVENLSEPNSH